MLVSALVGGAFHLTPGDLTLASLATGLLTAGIVAFFQTRRRNYATNNEDRLREFAVQELSDLKTENQMLRDENQHLREMRDDQAD